MKKGESQGFCDDYAEVWIKCDDGERGQNCSKSRDVIYGLPFTLHRTFL